MRHATTMILLLLCLTAACGAGHAETARDPFETTNAAEIPPDYERAIQQLTVKGILRTASAKRIIVSIAGIDGLAVLKRGDRLALNYRERPHVFTVGDVGMKSVRFLAVPAASRGASEDGAAYEVLVR